MKIVKPTAGIPLIGKMLALDWAKGQLEKRDGKANNTEAKRPIGELLQPKKNHANNHKRR